MLHQEVLTARDIVQEHVQVVVVLALDVVVQGHGEVNKEVLNYEKDFNTGY